MSDHDVTGWEPDTPASRMAPRPTVRQQWTPPLSPHRPWPSLNGDLRQHTRDHLAIARDIMAKTQQHRAQEQKRVRRRAAQLATAFGVAGMVFAALSHFAPNLWWSTAFLCAAWAGLGAAGGIIVRGRL